MNSTSDHVIKALSARWRKPVKARNAMQFSSVHARTYAGQHGILRGYFVEPEQNGSVLAAVSFRQGVAWVDYRDLEIREG